MSADTESAREGLRYAFEDQAASCRKNAAKFPDDASHLEAAKVLDHLAETTADIEPYVLDAYDELFEGSQEFEQQAIFAEFLELVGFPWKPSTAAEFLANFMAKARSR
jgi:hypothetical protein